MLNRNELSREQYLSLKSRVKRGGDRWAHLAYGLIRGTSYNTMEATAHDRPQSWYVAIVLFEAGYKNPTGCSYAWSEKTHQDARKAIMDEIEPLLTWVPKKPRIKKVRDAA